MDLARFNTAPADEITPVLLACCDVPAWAATVRTHRPYPDLDGLLAVADKAVRHLTPAEVEQALAAHPRIGEHLKGGGTAADWSRHEQAGATGDTAVRQALVEGNRAYEDRFGRVFLVCASGLSAEQILTCLRTRLGNDEVTEAGVVADELRKIALFRLRKAIGP